MQAADKVCARPEYVRDPDPPQPIPAFLRVTAAPTLRAAGAGVAVRAVLSAAARRNWALRHLHFTGLVLSFGIHHDLCVVAYVWRRYDLSVKMAGMQYTPQPLDLLNA